jgi:hypothetical protein
VHFAAAATAAHAPSVGRRRHLHSCHPSFADSATPPPPPPTATAAAAAGSSDDSTAAAATDAAAAASFDAEDDSSSGAEALSSEEAAAAAEEAAAAAWRASTPHDPAGRIAITGIDTDIEEEEFLDMLLELADDSRCGLLRVARQTMYTTGKPKPAFFAYFSSKEKAEAFVQLIKDDVILVGTTYWDAHMAPEGMAPPNPPRSDEEVRGVSPCTVLNCIAAACTAYRHRMAERCILRLCCEHCCWL